MKKVFIVFSISVLLTGCSSYQSDLDCGVDRGVPCTSLSAISEMIDQGDLPEVKHKSSQNSAPDCKDGTCSNNKPTNWLEMLVVKQTGDERWVIELP